MHIVKAIEIVMDQNYGEDFDIRNEALGTIMDRCGVVFVGVDRSSMFNSQARQLVEKSDLSKGEAFHTKM